MIVADAGNEFLLLVGRLHSDFDEFEAVSRNEKRQPRYQSGSRRCRVALGTSAAP